MIAEEAPTKETTDVYTPESQEEVTNPEPQKVATPEASKQLQKIQSNFAVTLASIAKMAAHAKTLTIAGHEDKTGFNAVYSLRQAIKDQRVDVEKKAKDLKAPHLEYNREVDRVAALLVGPMKEVEAELNAMEKVYNEARDKAKKEKELAQQRRIVSRAKNMRSFGFEYDEVRDAYVFVNQRTGEEVTIPFEDIREKSDDDFAPSYALAKTTFDEEQAALAQIKRDQEAEAQQIKDQQAAAQKVIDDQRRDFEAQQAEFNRQQAEFAEQQRQLKAQQDQIIIDRRVPQLLEVGFKLKGKTYSNGNVFVKPEMLVVLTDEVFAGMLTDARAYADEQEQARIDRENAEQQAEIDKHNADQERQTRLAPEKGRFLAYLEKLWGMPIPTMTEPEMEGVSESFGGELEKLITHYQTQIEQL
jgi:hypothetical protein